MSFSTIKEELDIARMNQTWRVEFKTYQVAPQFEIAEFKRLYSGDIDECYKYCTQRARPLVALIDVLLGSSNGFGQIDRIEIDVQYSGTWRLIKKRV